jgi:hypothetical protein
LAWRRWIIMLKLFVINRQISWENYVFMLTFRTSGWTLFRAKIDVFFVSDLKSPRKFHATSNHGTLKTVWKILKITTHKSATLINIKLI